MSKSIHMKGLPGKKRGGFPGHQVCSRGMGPDELAYIYIYFFFRLLYPSARLANHVVCRC